MFWRERIEEKKEVTPDELLERFKEAAGDPGSLYDNVLEYLEPYMAKAILTTNADAITKAEAIYSFGDLMGAYRELLTIYRWFAGFVSQYPEGGFFKKDMEDIVTVTRDVTKEVIEVYSNIKKVRTLDVIIFRFWQLASKLDHHIDVFVIYLLKYIAGLRSS